MKRPERLERWGPGRFVWLLLPAFFASSAFGGLIGTSVIGTYSAAGAGVFYGPLTQVIGPAIEFSFSDSPPTTSTLNSDFSDTGLTISFTGIGSSPQPLTLTFQSLTPGAFFSIAQLTNSFPATTIIGANANIITWTWNSGGASFTNPNFTATFAITSAPPAPEPGTAMMWVGGLGLLAIGRHRLRRA